MSNIPAVVNTGSTDAIDVTGTDLQSIPTVEHDCSKYKMLNKMIQGSYGDNHMSAMIDYYFGGNYE